MATELAKAYVQIVPSMDGVGTEIKQALGDIGDEAGKTAGESGGKKFGGSFVDFAKAAITGDKGGMATAAIGMATTAAAGIGKAMVSAGKAFLGGVVNMTKQAVSNYAEFEQLAGGAELLFGDAYDYIADKAKGAWATVQMSQNEYLQQANGFAVGLKSSLGGNEQAAAELADKILTAEADIVAATGNTQEAVQNAFNGIMRGNFSMVDNLQLGLTPTKEGYQDMIDQVNAWNTAQGNATNYQMGNLADMEAALVDYVAMQGLAGYAANEATETISGSISALRASWQNLLTDLANPDADITASIDAVITSAETALQNLLPVVETAVIGIGDLIAQVAPIIAEELPGLVEQILPSLLSAATSLISGLVAALPTIIQVLAEQAPMIINTIVTGLIDNLPAIISAAVQIIGALVIGLIQAIPQIVAALPQILAAIVNGISQGIAQLILVGVNLIAGLAQGMLNKIGSVTSAVSNIWTAIKNGIKNKVSQALSWGRDLIQNFVNGIKAKFQAVKDSISSVASSIKSFLGFSEPELGPLSNFHTYAPDMMMLFAQGIRDNVSLVTGAVDEVTAATMGSFRGLNGEIAVTASGNYTRSGVNGGTSVTVPEINIYQQPGEDTDALVERLGYELGLQVRQKGAVYAS